MVFQRAKARLSGFRRHRRHKKWRPKGRRTPPAGTVSQPIGKPFNGQAKGLLWLTWKSYAGPPQYFIPPEGGALNPPVRRSRSQAEPWQPRAKGPAAGSTLTPVRACQPSGILESTALVPIPTASKGAWTFTFIRDWISLSVLYGMKYSLLIRSLRLPECKKAAEPSAVLLLLINFLPILQHPGAGFREI